VIKTYWCCIRVGTYKFKKLIKKTYVSV